jgi:hypothetical protein
VSDAVLLPQKSSGNRGSQATPRGDLGNPRRSLDAVQRLESLGVDPIAEVVALAQDPALPKSLRLKAWLTLCEYAYPRLATIVPNESVSIRLEELQHPWDAITLAKLKETFRKELDTCPTT